MKRNLVELGMIKDASVQDVTITVTLALPFKEIPIKDELVRNVREAVAKLNTGLEVEVDLVEMSQQERAAFMTAAEGGREGWCGQIVGGSVAGGGSKSAGEAGGCARRRHHWPQHSQNVRSPSLIGFSIGSQPVASDDGK
jgi:metal-sulfur cluster biosynthetic enzyme